MIEDNRKLAIDKCITKFRKEKNATVRSHLGVLLILLGVVDNLPSDDNRLKKLQALLREFD